MQTHIMAAKLDILLCPTGLYFGPSLGSAQFDRIEKLLYVLRQQTSCRNVFITLSHRIALQRQWPFYPHAVTPPYPKYVCDTFRKWWSLILPKFKIRNSSGNPKDQCTNDPQYNDVVSIIENEISRLNGRNCVNLIADCKSPCNACADCHVCNSGSILLQQYDYHFWYPDNLPMDGNHPFIPMPPSHPHPNKDHSGRFKDAKGNLWEWDHLHDNHWNVEHPDGTYTNVSCEGRKIN